MRIILLLLSFVLSSVTFAGENMVNKKFSKRFSAYTVAPNGELSESDKEARLNTSVASSKTIIINRVKNTCVEYENKSGWSVDMWEANDLGWISGEGEVKAIFLCKARNSTGGCHSPECSLGCSVYGGICCEEYCSIY